MAVLEFVFASLTDANETDRHLLIFHALTEMTICFTAALTLTVVLRFGILRRGPRAPSARLDSRTARVPRSFSIKCS
jgi:hypothetical protein